MFPDSLTIAASQLLNLCRAHGLRLTTAESCTGGMLASVITTISGASDVYEMGFITYSNEAKYQMIGVDTELLDTYGAVSEETARAMAKGALDRANADIALAITGIAGPTGGTGEKPVGLVYVACAMREQTVCNKHIFRGNRQRIRLHACSEALEMALNQLSSRRASQ